MTGVSGAPALCLHTGTPLTGASDSSTAVANDLVIAGPRPGAHGPPWGDGHRPAVAREGGAFNANRAGQATRPILVYQDALRRFQRAPVTALPVRQDEHRPRSGNRGRADRIECSATA
jgi:hypothetical protein